MFLYKKTECIISEGALLSNLTYFFINASCMHSIKFDSCIFGKNVRILHVTGSILENPVQTRYRVKFANVSQDQAQLNSV